MMRNENEAQFEAFFEKNRGFVERTIHGIVKDAELTQDIVQETFLKFFAAGIPCEAEFSKSWLIVTARNYALNVQKKRKWEIMIEKVDEYPFSDEAHEVSAEQQVIEKMKKEKDFLRAEKILAQLYAENKRWYEAVVKVYCQGKKQQETAVEMGMSLGGLQSLLHRAKAWVIKKYEEEE